LKVLSVADPRRLWQVIQQEACQLWFLEPIAPAERRSRSAALPIGVNSAADISE
jgi:hypothetical protein